MITRYLEKPTVYTWLCGVFSLLSSLALLSSTKIPSWENALNLTGGSENRILTTIAKLRLIIDGKGVLSFFVALALFLFFRWFCQRAIAEGYKIHISALILSFTFALIMIVGMSIQAHNSLDFILANRFQMMYSFLLLLGYWALFYAAIITLFKWLDRVTANGADAVPAMMPSKFKVALVFVLDKHPFAAPMLIMLICWLPYWIAFFPGSVQYDAFYQFDQYFGVYRLTDHHPVASTLLYGSLMHLGRIIGNDNLGVFFCTLFQHILFSACLAYSLCCMRKWKVCPLIRFITLLFYCFCPLVAFVPQNVMKDGIYSAFIMLFGLFLINIIGNLQRNESIVKMLLLAVVAGIAASLIRHNGIYVCAAALFALLLFKSSRRNQRLCALAAVLIIVGSSLFSNTLVYLLDAMEGSKAEALSVPFQQTARYIKEHGNEVTDEERAAIDAVLRYDELAEKYDPDLSDPVKGTYRNNTAALPKYFSTWFQMFLKHPVTYIEATLCNTYSYYYPNGESTVRPFIDSNISENPAINTGFFDIKYEMDAPEMRKALDSFQYFLKNFPGIGLVLHAGTYTWILLLVCAYAIYRNKKYIILGTTPAMLNILVCIASPVNGYFRYFLSTLLLTPVIVGWMLREMEAGGHSPKTTNQR